MRTPCDEVVVRVADDVGSCSAESRTWVLIATILASSMAFIDSTVVNVALPSIQTSFQAGVAGMQWVVESYGLLLAALILVGGSFGDAFGRRRVFIMGVFVFALASLACALSNDLEQLIFARGIQGIGAALLIPGSLAIISASFDQESRGRAIGTWSGFTAITMAVGPVLGGWLIEHASWRWAFFINLPFAIVVIAISWWRMPESRNAIASRLDWIGATLATLGLGGVIGGLIESVNLGWVHPAVLGMLAVGVVSFCGFAWVEVRTDSPMIPLTLFKSRAFSGANLLTLFLYSAMGIFFFLLPLNLIQVQRYSAAAAGAAIFPLILLMFFLSRWSGGFVERYGPRLPLSVGPLIAAIAFGRFALPSIGHQYWSSFFPPILILGFGLAVTVAPLTTVVMNAVPEERVGAASGINNAIARVAGVVAIAVLGIVMVRAFTARLDQQLVSSSLSPDVIKSIESDHIKLAGIPVPDALDSSAKQAIRRSIDNAFVFGFSIIMLICAGLSVVSATVSWLTIPNHMNAHDTWG